MSNIRSPFAHRLRTARNEAGHRTASAAARSLGVPVPTVVAHEAAGSNHRPPMANTWPCTRRPMA